MEVLTTKRSEQSCILVNFKNILCYVSKDHSIYHAQAQDDVVTATRIFDLSTYLSFFGKNQKENKWIMVWDFNALETSKGDIVAAWLLDSEHEFSIHALYLKTNGEVTHTVVKRFLKFEPVFDLRFSLNGPEDLLFLYIYPSEHYFSPIADRGDIAKLWALHWKHGSIVAEKQLSEKGKNHTVQYDVRNVSKGRYHIVSIEEKLGLFGFKNRLKTGELIIRGNSIHFKKIASIKVDQDPYHIASYLVPSKQGETTIFVRIDSNNEVAAYKVIDFTGKELNAFTIKGNIGGLSYDKDSALFQYIEGEWYTVGGLSQPTILKLHWTDFVKRKFENKLELSKNSVKLEQPAGDCYYWLELEKTGIELKRKCRVAKPAPKPSSRIKPIVSGNIKRLP